MTVATRRVSMPLQLRSAAGATLGGRHARAAVPVPAVRRTVMATVAAEPEKFEYQAEVGDRPAATRLA